MGVVNHLWRNLLWQWLEKGCRKPTFEVYPREGLGLDNCGQVSRQDDFWLAVKTLKSKARLKWMDLQG